MSSRINIQAQLAIDIAQLSVISDFDFFKIVWHAVYTVKLLI